MEDTSPRRGSYKHPVWQLRRIGLSRAPRSRRSLQAWFSAVRFRVLGGRNSSSGLQVNPDTCRPFPFQTDPRRSFLSGPRREPRLPAPGPAGRFKAPGDIEGCRGPGEAPINVARSLFTWPLPAGFLPPPGGDPNTRPTGPQLDLGMPPPKPSLRAAGAPVPHQAPLTEKQSERQSQLGEGGHCRPV